MKRSLDENTAASMSIALSIIRTGKFSLCSDDIHIENRKQTKSLRTISLGVSSIELEHRISWIRWIIIMNPQFAENTSWVTISIVTQLVIGYPFHKRRTLIGSFKPKADHSERKWPVGRADVLGEERMTSLSTSAWEAIKTQCCRSLRFFMSVLSYKNY